MNTYTKIELLKYAKHFMLKQKNNIAIIFLKQIINKSTSKLEIIKLDEIINELQSENCKNQELVINEIDEIIKKNYPKISSLDNSTMMILG